MEGVHPWTKALDFQGTDEKHSYVYRQQQISTPRSLAGPASWACDLGNRPGSHTYKDSVLGLMLGSHCVEILNAFFFLATLHGIWDLTLTRDRTRGPLQWECRVLTTGPPGKSPLMHF